MSTLTPTDIKGDSATGVLPRISAHVYDGLTGADDAVCEAAIAAAELWLESVLTRAAIVVDYEVTEVREAAILRTLYELYAFGESEGTARDKKKEALLCLQRKYGATVSDDISDAGKAQQESSPGMPAGAMAAGTNTRMDTF